MIVEAARNLLMVDEYFKRNAKTQPSVLVIICGLTDFVYKREDGVIVVPITALKD